MRDDRNTRSYRQSLIVIGILVVLVFGAYSNTFHSSWQLDDYPTLVHNPRLHLKDLSLQSLADTFYSRPAVLGSTYRPAACLSLALNWYFGGRQVAGYHFVNISIHILTAFFLYLTIFNLCRIRGQGKSDSDQAFRIALLATVLWALNPIQTQAVTYIVQRMASLAAMFYILGIYLYIKGRTGKDRRRQFLFFTGVLVCYMMAIWSKENAIIMPLSLFLTEAVFFQNLDSPATANKIRMTAAAIGLLLAIGLILSIFFANDIRILSGYQARSFTIGQRLLTEPRVIIFYLSQLFYPMPQRLSIEHPVAVSTSLFEPWTTLAALALVIILVGLGVFLVRKRPVTAFALLFFFLNHLVESTVLPLELVFEHRNYLPSLFLFWPIAAWVFKLIEGYRQKTGTLSAVLVSAVVLLVIGLGISTYIRNDAWATETSLWQDAMNKAPGRARPTYNLAKQYTGAGRLDEAKALYHKALTQDASRPKNTTALTLNGIASIYFKKGHFERVREYCLRALEVKPEFDPCRKNLVLALAKLNRWDEVDQQLNILLKRNKNSKVYQFLKGELLLKQNRPQEALAYFRRALRSAPRDKKILLNIGIGLSMMGRYRQAEWFLVRAKKLWPGDIRAYLYLIEAGLVTPGTVKAERYLDELLTRFTIHMLKDARSSCFDDYGLRSASRKLICNAVNAKIIALAEEMIRKGNPNTL